ncbi:hypothetical protein [Nitrosomonas eutropha]|uniref:hypothetical protein n=1 Tax=Nitrosomonas eutropha TaxID=916 RepID=UPI0015A67B28|nr:hypothetical protein [Nitrosomonas eutropha]
MAESFCNNNSNITIIITIFPLKRRFGAGIYLFTNNAQRLSMGIKALIPNRKYGLT